MGGSVKLPRDLGGAGGAPASGARDGQAGERTRLRLGIGRLVVVGSVVRAGGVEREGQRLLAAAGAATAAGRRARSSSGGFARARRGVGSRPSRTPRQALGAAGLRVLRCASG